MTEQVSVFSIDPGISTGWAYQSEWDCNVGTITTIETLHKVLLDLMLQFQPSDVIIERMPSVINQKVNQVVFSCEWAIARYTVKELERISPGEWKPLTRKEPLPFKMDTQHEKDAYRMGRYWLYKNKFVARIEI